MRRSSTGQAALEFLITYGWAFFAIIIGMAALMYFGVVNIEGLLPARCEFHGQVFCQEQLFEQPSGEPKGKVNIVLTNDFGVDLYVKNVTIKDKVDFTCEKMDSVAPGPIPWSKNSALTLTLSGCSGSNWAPGKRMTTTATVYFFRRATCGPDPAFGADCIYSNVGFIDDTVTG